MIADVLSSFRELCDEVACAYMPTLGEDELEPLYEGVLNFLIAHPAEKSLLAQQLIVVMGKYRTSREPSRPLLPCTAISYCMHELRWPEVYAFAEKENADHYSKKQETLMLSVLAAYAGDWEDRDFYRRFRAGG